MRPTRVLSGLALAGAGFALQGCVVAAAAPLAAGIAIGKSEHEMPRAPIIAILGGERASFDELYLYLKHQDAILPPDAMIDNGWFLASPVTNEG